MVDWKTLELSAVVRGTTSFSPSFSRKQYVNWSRGRSGSGFGTTPKKIGEGLVGCGRSVCFWMRCSGSLERAEIWPC